MIRAIIFDCFGVLYTETIEHFYNLGGEDKREALHDLVAAVDRAQIPVDEFFRQAVVLTNRPEAELHTIIESDHVRNEPLIEQLRGLKNHYKIGLLTNVNIETLDIIFPPEERAELFDVEVVSGVERLIKPDPAIYEVTAAKFGLPLDECLFIDDRQINVDGAERVGMHAMLYRNNQQLEGELSEFLKSHNA